MSSHWLLETNDFNGPVSNIDAMMHTVVSSGYSAAALMLANMVIERMRMHVNDDTDKFTGSQTPSSDLLEKVEDMDPKALESMAWSMDLTKMPKDLLLLVLPLLLHLDTQCPTPDDIHALHEFCEASKADKIIVNMWIMKEPAKSTLEQAFKPWVNYSNFKDAYKARDNISTYNASRDSLPHSHRETYAYQFVQACQCTTCLELIVDLGLVDFQHYGRNGKSLLHAVIESGHHESIVFAIENLLSLGADPRHSPTSINGMSIPQHVALLHDNNIFKEMVEKLEAAEYPICAWNDDGLKLELCSFITAELAGWLLSKRFNIAKLPRNTLPNYLPLPNQMIPPEEACFTNDWNRDAEYSDPIIRSRTFDSDAHEFDPFFHIYDFVGVTPSELHPTSRTIWHRAIENPQGPIILDWLLDHSHVQPGCKSDFDRDTGETALVVAAKGNEPAGIDWLCQNCDPMAPRFRDQVDESQNTPAYALQTAAHSVQPNSAAILYMISSYAPPEVCHDLAIMKDLYWLVIKGYKDAHLRLVRTMQPSAERMQHMNLLRNITRGKIKVLNTRLQLKSDWVIWWESGELRWLLEYCALEKLNFIVRDMKSGISIDLQKKYKTAQDWEEEEDELDETNSCYLAKK
jgi:hypothetical protein